MVAGGDRPNAIDITGLEVSTTVLTNAGVGVVASGFTINSCVARTALRGKLIDVKLDIINTAAITSTSGDIPDTTIITLVAALRPTDLRNFHFSAGAPSGDIQVNADGTCVIRSANVSISATSNIRASFSYMNS
jgi:hypothetical protein